MTAEKVYRAIGLMSGTSLDGEIDVALLETDGQSYVKPLGFYAHAYDPKHKDVIRAAFGHKDRNEAVGALVTDLHIEAVRASGFEADIIGFHGQTVFHDPYDGITVQLGDGTRMAKELGVKVVNDFRSADMKAGGQGAPLLPVYHKARLLGQKEPVVILNIGGVSNITYINNSFENELLRTGAANASAERSAAGGCRLGGLGDETLIAFDCGPGNALMDDYCRMVMDCPFDKDGAIARSGHASQEMVAMFLEDDFFEDAPPKSLDRDEWGLDLVGGLTPEDAMATLLDMSVRAVWRGFSHLPFAPARVYVCGGGAHNGFMMERLAEVLGVCVEGVETLGWNGDATEAEGFAYMAVRSMLGLPISFPFTTGVKSPITGGVMHYL